MLRAQTRGNSEIHEVFVNKIAVVDLRAGRSDASEALRQWEAAAGIHAHYHVTAVQHSRSINERPFQHNVQSWSQLVVDPSRGLAIAPRYTITCRFESSYLGNDFGSSSRAGLITRFVRPCSGLTLHRRHLPTVGPAPPKRSRSAHPHAQPVPPPLPC